MPAHSNARKPKEPNASRPFGSVTQFPGSVVFSRENGTSHGHLYRVLTGERTSMKIVNAYAAFLDAQDIAWPSAAKVKPSRGKAASKKQAA